MPSLISSGLKLGWPATRKTRPSEVMWYFLTSRSPLTSYYDLAGLGVLAAVDHAVTVVDAELLYRGAVDLEEGGAFRACNQELVDVKFAVFEVFCGGWKPAGLWTGPPTLHPRRLEQSQASAGRGGS